MKDLSERERILTLENNHNNLMDKLDDILDKFNEFELKLDKALEKKADVWVEKAVSWAIYLVVGILITSITYLVIKK